MRASSPKLRRWISGVTVAVIVVAVAVASPPVWATDDESTETTTPKKTKLRENSYYYGAFNKRDPFRSLVQGRFVRDSVMELVDLTGVELVGIVKGDLDRFALLEDDKGFSYILRVGDRVRRGTVVAIGEQTLTARITHFGQTSKLTLHIVQRHKGDKR